MLMPINIPFGLCQITYGDINLPIQADEAIFEAIPTYKKIRGGVLGKSVQYLLADYDVTFDVSFNKENYDILKLHYPVLNDLNDGLVDNPNRVDTTGKRLVIHPLGTDSKEYDLTIFKAYIEPMTFRREYKKETDKFNVKFVGKPVVFNRKLEHSYFYIGDSSQLEGVELWH